MRILLKYTLKSIGEKKFRAFLIIFAIALAGALFLASSRLSANIADMYLGQIKAAYGDVDISIYPNEDSPSSFISMSACEKIRDKAELIIPYMTTSAEYKEMGTSNTQNISVDAYNIEEYQQINKLMILEGNVEEFEGPKMILSKKGAKELGLSVGDEVNLTVARGKRKITIAAIADTEGIFKSEEGYILAIMPFDTICKYVKTNNRPTTIHIKLKEGVDKYEVIETLQGFYPKYDVEETVDTVGLEEDLSSITVPFMLMTCIVIFMSVFIIYSSFKVIMLEKLPIVGTFRSVGASKGVMNAVLLLEALLYGIIGGILACGLGVGCLYVLTNLMSSMFGMSSGDISLIVSTSTYLTTFILCMTMAVLSTLAPIISISKISLKDIILNNRPHKRGKYVKNAVIGITLIGVGFILAKYVQKDLAMLTSMLGTFIMIIGIIKLLPLFVLYASQILGGVFMILFGNIGELATKNIKKNKSVLNSITLITIGISILLAISTMTQNVSDQVVDFYKDTFKCDLRGYVGGLDDQRIRYIKRNENIDEVITVMNGSFRIPELGDKEIYPEAIEVAQLSPNIVYNLLGDEHELLVKLQEGRNIIVSEILKKECGLEVGDLLSFKFGKTTKQYEIIGFMDSMWQNGNFALMPIKYFKRDVGRNTYDLFYATVKEGADPEAVATELTDSIRDTWSYIVTIEYMTQMNEESNASMMGMISIFAILAMFIGVIGVINNLMISFIERRQNIAMLRSIGMSKRQVLKMIFVEGIGSGLIGAIGGIGGGILTCWILQYVLDAMQMTMDMVLIPRLFIDYLIGGTLITVIGSIIPARGSSKLNIIEAIKYE